MLGRRLGAGALLLLVFVAVAGARAQAAYAPGSYEVYDGQGRKTGTVQITISSTTYHESPVTRILSVTTLQFPGLTSSYNFEQTDEALVGPTGLLFFQRKTNDNGKLSSLEGEKKSGQLTVRVDRPDNKYIFGLSTSTYDMAEFEMDLPSSKFSTLKNPGDTTAARVFLLDSLSVELVSRNIASFSTIPYDEEKAVETLVMSTLIRGKATTSWLRKKDRALLQEEGLDFRLLRVSKPKR